MARRGHPATLRIWLAASFALAMAACDATSPVFTSPPRVPIWVSQFGTERADAVASVELSHSGGYVYVGGWVDGQYGVFSGPSQRPFLAKYGRDGTRVWYDDTFGDDGESAVGLAWDATGPFVALRAFPEAGSLQRAKIMKFDPEGSVQWTRIVESQLSSGALVLDGDGRGNAYLGGFSFGSLSGQPVDGIYTFVRRYDRDGEVAWTREWRTDAVVGGIAVAEQQGWIYVGGTVPAELGALPGQVPQGGHDMYVKKLDEDGNELWTRQFGTPLDDEATPFDDLLAADLAGNVYVAGMTAGAFPGEVSAGSRDVFVRKYDPDGTELWTRQFGSPLVDMPFGLDANNVGYTYVVGGTEGSLPAAGPLAETYDAGEPGDPFIVRLSPDGDLDWTYQPLAEAVELDVSDPMQFDHWFRAVAANRYFMVDGTVIVGGVTSGHLVFGELLGETSHGDFDAVLLRISQREGPPGSPSCSDGFDNDGDGLVDAEDPNCREPEPPF